jgi:hypothetical protein
LAQYRLDEAGGATSGSEEAALVKRAGFRNAASGRLSLQVTPHHWCQNPLLKINKKSRLSTLGYVLARQGIISDQAGIVH